MATDGGTETRHQGGQVSPLHAKGEPRGRLESTLVNRNVFVQGRRTSLRLEPAMWDALGEISQRENKSIHQLCSVVDERRSASSLTAAIRVFIMTYFRAAATEEGHASIGHGALYRVKGSRLGRGQSARPPIEPAESRAWADAKFA